MASLTTYFNLAQLFSSVLLLALSDIIGRKPVYLGIIVVYAITSGCLLIVP